MTDRPNGTVADVLLPADRLLVDAADAAALCSVSRRTWATWLSSGRVPEPVRVGDRKVLWRVGELRAWTEAGCPPADRWAQLKGAIG